jgi:hypothetical protein
LFLQKQIKGIIITVLAKIGHINQILEIQMHPVSQTQPELVFKNK